MADNNIKSLFLAYRGELQAFLMRKVRDAEIAADLTQEAFARYAEHMAKETAPAIANQRAYLYRVANNLATDHLRGTARRGGPPVHLDFAEQMPDETPSPEHKLGDKQDLDLVRTALMDLPVLTRQIVVLHRVQGMTYKQVAERLAISESSVQKHLAKAIRHILRLTRPEEIP